MAKRPRELRESVNWGQVLLGLTLMAWVFGSVSFPKRSQIFHAAEAGPISGRETRGSFLSSQLSPEPTRLQESMLEGRIVDWHTGLPIRDAVVYHDGKVARSKPDGRFAIAKSGSNQHLFIKASGYRRASVPLRGSRQVALMPFDAKGVYLTHYGISSRLLKNRVLGLIRRFELNSLVIDIKGDRGYLSYRTRVPLASEIGAHKLITIRDIGFLIDELHREGIYVIGRIVVFKDDVLARSRPHWAVIDRASREPWRDGEKLAWVDPFRREVCQYNIDLARDAAQVGFDEIQFDYMRFPSDGPIRSAQFSQVTTMENRVRAISRFLEGASQSLLPYNVYFSGDLFGYIPWNSNDTDIGQNLEEVSKYLDYLSLMVYPSGYHLGIPGCPNPVEEPREVVFRTLERARHRLEGQSKKLRPWLQNFKDYAFDRRSFTGREINLQIQACLQAGTSGWLLWDPSNKYRFTPEALEPSEVSHVGQLFWRNRLSRLP